MVFHMDFVLTTTCAFLPAAVRSLVLTTIAFLGFCAQRSCPKEGGQTPPPPVTDSLVERYGIPAAVGEKFYLISITVVSGGSLCQALVTGRSIRWTSI